MPDGTKKIVCGKSIAALKAVEDTLGDAKHLLSHESISVTADIYTSIGSADMTSASETLNAYFSKKISKRLVNGENQASERC